MSPATAREEDRRLGLLWGGVGLGVVVLSPLLSRLTSLLPPCPMKWLTGLPCPGCGTGRAARALAHVNVLDALRLNPLTAVGMLALVFGGIVVGGFALAGRPLRIPSPEPTAPLRAALALLLVANWLWLLVDGR